MANEREAMSGAALARLAPWLLGGFGLVMLLLVGRSFAGSSGFGYDFDAYYAAALRLVNGDPLYGAGLAEAYNSGNYAGLYLYPPPLAVLLTPIAAVFGADGIAGATDLWLWLRNAVLVGGIAILPVSAVARGATLAVSAISFPTWYDLNLGNISVLLVALSAVIWRFRDRPIGALALAATGVIRYPFGVVLVGWALARRWRQVGLTIVFGLILVLLTLPGAGVQSWLDYVQTITSLGNVSAGEHNLSFATTAHALGLPAGGLDSVWVPLGIAIAVVATAWAARRRDSATATVVALTATILAFPFFHPHYLAQLAIPAAFLAGRGQWWGLALPLLGWLPGEWMAPAAALATVAPLAPPRLLAFGPGAGTALRSGAEPRGAAAGS